MLEEMQEITEWSPIICPQCGSSQGEQLTLNYESLEVVQFECKDCLMTSTMYVSERWVLA